MSFLQQYDRLFLLTLGLVAVLRGVGGLASFFVVLLDPAASTHGAERSQSVVLASMAILHSAVLLVSGAGLLLRRPFGWKLSVAFQANELGKLAGALLITLLLGANADSIRAGTDVLVQMAWALFSLLVFLLDPIARLCRIEGRVVGAAAGWILLGVLLSLVKLASVM
jgi:hypothetical protein